MPKVDPESGEPMPDDPDGPEEAAGGKVEVDPKDQRDPGDDFGGSAS